MASPAFSTSELDLVVESLDRLAAGAMQLSWKGVKTDSVLLAQFGERLSAVLSAARAARIVDFDGDRLVLGDDASIIRLLPKERRLRTDGSTIANRVRDEQLAAASLQSARAEERRQRMRASQRVLAPIATARSRGGNVVVEVEEMEEVEEVTDSSEDDAPPPPAEDDAPPPPAEDDAPPPPAEDDAPPPPAEDDAPPPPAEDDAPPPPAEDDSPPPPAEDDAPPPPAEDDAPPPPAEDDAPPDASASPPPPSPPPAEVQPPPGDDEEPPPPPDEDAAPPPPGDDPPPT